MAMLHNLLTNKLNRLLNHGLRSIAVLVVVLSLGNSTNSIAQDALMAWDFTGYAGNEATGTATTFFTNISSTSPSGVIQRGAGLTSNTNADRFNARGWGQLDLASAITANDYMDWTITPDLGYEITITSIVYNFRKSTTGPASITIQGSHDSYTTDLDTKSLPGNTNNGLVSVVSGVTNINSALTFRIYGYSGTGNGSGGFEGPGDDIIIYGTVSLIQDFDSEVNAPASQVTGATILSTANTIGSAVDVFKFNINDKATTDAQPTHVTNIRLTPGTNNTADWTDHIQGVTLNDGSSVTIGALDIQDSYIDIPISSGDLDIANSTNSDVTLAIYLNASNIVDDAILSFLVDATNHNFTADNSGSQFAAAFPNGDIASNDFTINVEATKMLFFQQPTNVLINDILSPSVTVGFTDDNGNIDVGYATEDISIAANTVTLSGSSTTLQEVQANGLATFDDLAFSTSGSGTLTATDATSSLSAVDIVSSSFEVLPVLSVIQAVASSETAIISSIVNDATITLVSEGAQVWQLDLFDGDGTNPDNDGKPTNYTNITISQHASNQIANWQDAILAVGFFEGSTHIPGIVTINQTNISFSPSSAISVPDGVGNKKTISIRISIATTLPTGLDGSNFVFEVSEGNVTVETAATSSQLGTFTVSSSSSQNKLNIIGTKLYFIQQPTDVLQSQNIAPAVSVAFTDINNNIDVAYETEEVEISANVVTLIGGPVIEEVMPDGLATFSSLSFSTAGTGTLTALDVNDVIPPGGVSVVSNSFEVIETADHLTFVSVPTSGQVGQTITSFTVEARLFDESPDLNYTGDITIDASPGGSISGTLTQTAVSGVATFNDITFSNSGNFDLSAISGSLTEDSNPIIGIVGTDVSILPNGRETMTTMSAADPATIAAHDTNGDFDNSGALTFSNGGIGNEADIRGNASSNYSGASGGANIRFRANGADRGFAIDGIAASAYTDITLQFAVRKQDLAGTDFATLTVEYWDGDSWEVLTITGYPVNGDNRIWKLVDPVVLPAAAQISDLGIRITKSGTIACRVDDISLTGTPNAASNLIVATINGDIPPTVDVPFNIDLEVQDGSGQPANVLDDTDVELILQTGSGNLGGTLTATILAGTNTATIAGATYDLSEVGVVLTAQRTGGDNLLSGNSTAFNVIETEPITSATLFTVDNRFLNSIEISWTNGDGDERIVIAKEGAAVDMDPVDGATYIADADFQVGEDIGNGNIVVFTGIGTSVTITNLLANNIDYHFAVYEYNGTTSGLENYKQTTPAIGNALTTCSAPLSQASNLTFPVVQSNAMNISWDVGDGSGQVVVMNTTNSFVTPSVPPPAANSVWQNSGQQVMYIGDGTTTNVDVSGLSSNTEYWFRVYEINCTGADVVYNETDNAISQTTRLFSQDFTTCPPSGWLNVTITGNQNWTCGSGYATASGIGSSAPSEIWYVTPAINFNTITNDKLSFDSWTSGTDDEHPKLSVLYSLNYAGSGNPNIATWTELTFNTPSENSQVWTSSGSVDLSLITGTAYIAYKYVSSGTTAGSATEWRIDNVEIFSQPCATPTVATSNLSFANVAQETMTVNWTKGGGVSRIVIAREGSAVSFVPVDGTEYVADSDYSTATEVGTPGEFNKVVYSGGLDSFDLTGLIENTDYHFAIYEFNCNGTNRDYIGTALIGSQTSLSQDASDIIATASYVYKTDINYVPYDALSSLSTGSTIDVFGLTLRDEGFINIANSDGNQTELTSISFSTNGSTSVRAAGIFTTGGVRIGEKEFNNGGTSFTIDNFDNPFAAPSDGSIEFVLRVTFEDDVLDNEQIVFTVTGATADPLTSPILQPDAGAAQSIDTGGSENTIIVDATALNFTTVPTHSFPINETFRIIVEAVDSRDSRDRSKDLTISRIGTGILSTSSESKTTTNGTARWLDLEYDTEEDVEFVISDDALVSPLPDLSTGVLQAKPRFTLFTFTGNTGDEATAPPNFQSGNVTISDISRGTSLTAASRNNTFSSRSWPLTEENDSYYEITITPDVGFTFSISSIELDDDRSNTAPTFWKVTSSLDSYVATIDGLRTNNTTTWVRNNDVDFGAIAQDLSAPLTIRIKAYGASNGNGTWALDNIEIFGTTTDNQAPSFTATYPQKDSSRVDGFHLQANVDEPVSAYYLIKNTGDPAPVDPADIIDGIGNGVLNDTIIITTADSTYREIVTGLTVASGYDVYWVLDDGTNPATINASQIDVRTSDNAANVTAPVTQVPISSIASTADSIAEAVDVFRFDINDNSAAAGDGGFTNVAKIWIKNPTPLTTDWSTVIGGITLFGNNVGSIPITDVRVYTDSIVADIEIAGLFVQDQSSEIVTLGVYLNTSGIIDGTTLQFEISETDPAEVFESFVYGSQFTSPFAPATITSNVHTIDVTADRLSFFSYPEYPGQSVQKDQDFTVEIEVTDANGNRDTDDNLTIVSLATGLGSGIISHTTGVAMTNGIVQWTDVQYTVNELFTIIASDDASLLLSDTTNTMQAGNGNDLVVFLGNTFTVTGTESYDNVTVEDGGTLNLAQGAVLDIGGDFSIDGTGSVFNDLGGTTSFTDGNGQTIQSSDAGKTVTFFNIDIVNSSAQGVDNEININLINTLKLNAGANFDVDGSGDDKNFTLVSTSTATARIAAIEAGATLNGNIVWQRSLRSGPQGYRYISTPIQGQTLGNISDDIFIQGIAENYPGLWTNISTYSEPNGTTGQNGVDGWVPFTSNSNSIGAGVGMRLYLWNIDYQTEQVISNKGVPNMGDGTGDVSGDFNFPISFEPTSLDGGGWNFFANPYPSELDWENVSQTDLSGEAVYIWNPNTQQYGTYSAATNIGTGGVSQYISSGQGFFIKANSADVASSGSASLNVSESSKSSADGNSFLRLAEEDFPKMKIKLIANDGKYDETAIAFTRDASDNYDPNFDAIKLSGGWVNLSSKLENDKLIVINAMGEKKGVQAVKLNIEPYVYGSYTMKFPMIESFEEGAIMTLIDHYLQTSVPITASTEYVFNINKNVLETFGAERFEAQFLEPVKLRLDQIDTKSGEEFVMPVYADQLSDIISSGLFLNWDASELTFVGIEDVGEMDLNDFDLGDVDAGILSVNSTYTSPLSLPDNTILFSMRFMAGNTSEDALITIDEGLTNILAINDIEMPFSTTDGIISILQNRAITGMVATYTAEPVTGVTALAEGEESIEDITDNDGLYTLDVMDNSSYTVSASKMDAVKLNEAVTTLDIIRTILHLLQIREFESPYQSVAADVNMSKSITALDLIQMRKVVLGMDEGFSSGVNWLFIPETYDLTNDPFNFETSVDIDLINEDVDLDFVGVKIGDVNNSWTNQSNARAESGQIALNMEQLNITDDNMIEVPVVVADFKNISGYQFSISWDANQLEYYSVEQAELQGEFNEQFTSNGILTTIWYDADGKSVDMTDGDELFTLKFRVRDEQISSEIEINSSLTKAIAFDGELNELTINSVSANVNLEELRNGKLELYQNVPNPFGYNTDIQFKIVKQGLVKLSIINLLGETIYLHEEDYKPGTHMVNWDRSQSLRPATPGVYLYRLESNGEEVVKKMLIK